MEYQETLDTLGTQQTTIKHTLTETENTQKMSNEDLCKNQEWTQVHVSDIHHVTYIASIQKYKK